MELSTSAAQNRLDLAQSTAKQQGLTQTANGLKNGHMSKEKIQETAQNFEAMFLSQMLTYMMPETDTNAPFYGGKGEEVFKSFMTNEYAKLMAKTGKTGIADKVADEMIRIQEAAQAAAQNQGDQ